MFNKIMNFLEKNDIVISSLLFYNIDELGITYEEFYYLSYFLNQKDLILNVTKITEDLKKANKEILEVINSLTEKNIIELKDCENYEQIIDLSNLYKKMTLLIAEENEVIEEVDIKAEFVKALKRKLDTREEMIIDAWREVGYPDELILLAIEETSYSGFISINTIDSILGDWINKGLRTREEVMNSRKMESIEQDMDVFFDDDDSAWFVETI